MIKMERPIYLDCHATTPMDEIVLKEMLPYFCDKFGNSSSIDHIYGNEAQSAINKARLQVADLIGCEPEEIIFTSGATESNNLAIFGIADKLKEQGNHIITSRTEHKAILDSCKSLESKGYDITYLEVNKNGEIDLEELKRSITSKTILITIMSANNEVGTIAPLKKIGGIAHENNVIFHTDSAQACGHIPLNVKDMNIDMMSISGHKMYGPKGIGALYVRNKNPLVKITPIIYGGGHEKGFRSGTLNVPSIVGLGKASELANNEMVEISKKILKLRNMLFDGISSKVKVEINGISKNKLTQNLNLYFEDVDAKALINEVKNDLAISTGSACNSEDIRPSHVLIGMGMSEERAYSSIRFGLGKGTTEENIKVAINKIIESVLKLRNL
jgi:cysteine desulfurase